MRYSITLYSLFLCATLFAQKNSIFKAGAMIGISRSQVDGDYQAGYDRRALCLGLRGGIVIRPNIDLIFELNYQQKGSTPSRDLSPVNQDLTVDMKLVYAEVPVMLNFYFNKHPRRGHFRNGLQIGCAYGRMLSSDIFVRRDLLPEDALNKALVTENLRRDEWSFIAGFAFRFRHQIGLNFRLNQSLTPLYDRPFLRPVFPKRPEKDTIYFLRCYFLSAQLTYDFIAPKMKKERKRGA
jgi:Outer membrane protein beta-barrel domain